MPGWSDAEQQAVTANGAATAAAGALDVEAFDSVEELEQPGAFRVHSAALQDAGATMLSIARNHGSFCSAALLCSVRVFHCWYQSHIQCALLGSFPQ